MKTKNKSSKNNASDRASTNDDADVRKKSKVNHKELSDKIETVSMGLGITSAVATTGAALAAPTGITWLGVSLGLVSPPLIVIAAPYVVTVAGVTAFVSSGVYFYSRWKRKNTDDDLED